MILDEELLGEVKYDDETKFETSLEFGDSEMEQNIKKASDMFLSATTPDAATSALAAMQVMSKINKPMLQKWKQNKIDFKVPKYTGVKQFAGMLDGVIAWNKITVSMEDQCPYDLIEGETDEEKSGKTQSTGPMKLCFSGIENAAITQNIGQNGLVKQDQILSDLGALRNSINNTIFAIESDPTVQFCMTGRKVQGLKMGQDGKQERTEARFPNLIDQMKVIIAQSAIQKAQANYNKKYAELDEKLAKDNVALSDRIAQVRGEREKLDRTDSAARACLNLGANSALPATTGTDASKLKSGQGYTATSQNDDPYYRETVTTTFNPTTLVCKKCVRTQNCNVRKGYKDCCAVDSRYCKEWGDPVENCTETQF